jgi:hypothetical protein
LGKVKIPIRIERISVAVYEFVAFNTKIAKHSEKDGFSIVKFTEELPSSVAYPHKVQ